jgi:hypothetical protein
MYEIVNVQYTGTYNNGGTSIPAVLGEFRASSAADLPAQNVDCHIICGCDGLDIATGDRYIWNGTAWILQPSDRAFSNVYTKAEIDSMVNVIYQVMMYYHTVQESTDGTITFYTLGGNVGSLTIYGNGQQNGTPTPDAPIMPDFVGTLSGSDWTIPITCAGQTVPVYLGQVSTVRRIKKLVLTGEEQFYQYTYQGTNGCYGSLLDKTYHSGKGICSHYPVGNVGIANTLWIGANNTSIYFVGILDALSISTVSDFKSYLAAQYSAGNPVTVWYVLAEPETTIVNEPLAKIGDYDDELHLTKDDITIPTVSGENTLIIDTDITPSKIEISGER